MNDNREIRLIGPDRIREYMEIYTGAYTAFKDWSDAGIAAKTAQVTDSMEHDQNIHFYALYEDGRPIATMKLIDYEICLFGELRRATGLCSLAVHSLHKHRHAALDMVLFFEDYARKSGADIAILLPFNTRFYHNMGYGYQSRIMLHSVQTADLPVHRDISHLVMLSRADEAEILACQREYVRHNHGQLVKFEDEIRNIRGGETTRWVGYREDGRLTGYMSIEFVCDSSTNYTLNCMEVTELVYQSPEILRELLGYLQMQADQAQRVTLKTGEDDFYHLLADAADTTGNYIDFGGLQTNVCALNVMHKIFDPVRFVQNTAYRRFPEGSMIVRFDYLDELAGTRREITVKFADRSWAVAPADAEADLTVSCALADLTSLFMGSAGVSALQRLGVIQVTGSEDPGRLQQLDALLHVEQKPFSNSDF